MESVERTPGSTSNAKLFVSYGRQEDNGFVDELCSRLEKEDFSVWRDVSDLPNRGLSFPAELIVAIRGCDRLVFVVSPKSMGSPWCESEWQHALEEGKPVHPVLRLGDIDLVPADLRLFDVRDFRAPERFEREFRRLAEQLHEAIVPAGKLVAVPGLPPYHLPNLERMRELKEAFLADHHRAGVQSGAHRILGLHGMSGAGKSLLAAGLAKDYEVRRAHRDGIFWVHVGSKPDLAVLQQDLARLLDCRQTAFRDIQEGRFFLSAALMDKEALVILDDVWTADPLLAFDCLGPRCRMLITTQDRGLVTHMTGHEYPVNLPSPMEAKALLARCSGCPEGKLPPEADSILRECGNLPLAVSICGGRVAGGTAWADVLAGLQMSDSRFFEGQEKSVFRSIGAAIAGLPADDRQRLEELTALFFDEPVPESVVCLLWGQTGKMSPAGARDLLRVLADHHLITRQPAKLPDREAALTIHTLVRLCLERLSPVAEPIHAALVEACRLHCDGQWQRLSGTASWHRHLALHMARAHRWDELADLAFGGTFELFQRWTERGERLAGEECLRGMLQGLGPSRRNRSRRTAVATQLCRVQQSQGDYAGARALARMALCGFPLGEGVRARLVAWHELGNIELAEGNSGSATVCFLRKLLWNLMDPGANADEFRRTLCGLAAAQRDRFSWRLALIAARAALRLARGAGDRCAEAQTLILVGATLKSLGRYGEAENSFRQAKELASAFPMEHSHLLVQWGWMAFNQATLAGAAPSRATELFRAALEPAEFAGSYSLLADALTGLGWSRLVEGDGKEAGECFTRARSLLRGARFPSISDGVHLGELSLRYVAGEKDVARSGLETMIADCRQRREKLWRAHACVGLGACEWHDSRPEPAGRAWAEAEECAAQISNAAFEVIRAAIALCRLNPGMPPR